MSQKHHNSVCRGKTVTRLQLFNPKSGSDGSKMEQNIKKKKTNRKMALKAPVGQLFTWSGDYQHEANMVFFMQVFKMCSSTRLIWFQWFL